MPKTREKDAWEALSIARLLGRVSVSWNCLRLPEPSSLNLALFNLPTGTKKKDET
jgi:hypothetical protein